MSTMDDVIRQADRIREITDSPAMRIVREIQSYRDVYESPAVRAAEEAHRAFQQSQAVAAMQNAQKMANAFAVFESLNVQAHQEMMRAFQAMQDFVRPKEDRWAMISREMNASLAPLRSAQAIETFRVLELQIDRMSALHDAKGLSAIGHHSIPTLPAAMAAVGYAGSYELFEDHWVALGAADTDAARSEILQRMLGWFSSWIVGLPRTAVSANAAGLVLTILFFLLQEQQHEDDIAIMRQLQRSVDELGARIPTVASRAYIVTRPLNLRSGPTASAERVAIVGANAFVEEVGSVGPWVEVQYFDFTAGQVRQGWVKAKYLLSVSAVSE